MFEVNFLQIVYSWIMNFKKIYSSNLYLLIYILRLFTFNVIFGMVICTSVIFFIIFSISHYSVFLFFLFFQVHEHFVEFHLLYIFKKISVCIDLVVVPYSVIYIHNYHNHDWNLPFQVRYWHLCSIYVYSFPVSQFDCHNYFLYKHWLPNNFCFKHLLWLKKKKLWEENRPIISPLFLPILFFFFFIFQIQNIFIFFLLEKASHSLK